MGWNCTTDKYADLYARWLDNPGNLLDLAGYQPGQRLLDLCGGTGAVSLEALRRGADPSTIMLVDLNPRCPDTRIEQVVGDADNIGPTVFGSRQPECLRSFDVIVIRQAAAYLHWNVFMLNWLTGLLKPGGRLVFNTFAKPKWSLKTYKYGGRRYVEASAYFGRTVWHLQAAPGLGWDVSRFQWLDLPYLEQRLRQWFRRGGGSVQVVTHGSSVRVLCVLGGF